MEFLIKKGLDLPIEGTTSTTLETSKADVSRVALIGSDYKGMKPTMHVQEGDHVKAGQKVFACKRNEGLIFTAPTSGTVEAIHRGKKRVLQSLVIHKDAEQQYQTFETYKGSELASYEPDALRALLIESGVWTGLRQRPFDKVADVKGTPSSVFVTAMDTQPLAPSPELMINAYENAFVLGLEMLHRLTGKKVYVCVSGSSGVHTPIEDHIERVRFHGPHPAGNPGTHIHFVDPVHMGKYVWHINYQDVIAWGKLLETGHVFQDQFVSITGPRATNPKTCITFVGAQISELLQEQSLEGLRIVSGSVLCGHKAKDAFDFLGKYHHQITLIEEDTERELLGWHMPGADKFSLKNVFVSKLLGKEKFDLGSSTHGSPRAIVPIGSYESVMPMDILPTQLLRSLVSQDTDTAQELGCLELSEEDMSLLTFVSPGKEDFGPILRENLELIEKEG